MNEEPTTAAIQRCLDALHGDPAAESLIRGLLEQLADLRPAAPGGPPESPGDTPSS